MTPVPASIAERAKRNAEAARERERAELELKLFPDWPDDRRGTSNALIRAAVFGVGRRRRVADLPLAAPGGWSVTMTGWRLDQADCDVWLEVMHLARNSKPGEPIRFSLHSLLRSLGLTGDGGRDRRWLTTRLKGLYETTLYFESASAITAPGTLIASFDIDKTTGEAVVRVNPQMRWLYEQITYLPIAQRRALRGNPLAQSIHAVINSHTKWLPMRVETMMRRAGSEYAVVRYFRRDLRKVLADFERRGWIDAWRIDNDDLVHIALRPSPTQMRFLERERRSENQHEA